MALHLGNVPASSTLYIPFETVQSTGAGITMSGLAVTDIEIYKNGSTTQRASDTGFTLLDTDGIDFDGVTGLHGFSVDLSSDADAGFYSAGAFYWVVVNTITVAGVAVTPLVATFRIVASEGVAGVPKADVTHIDSLATAGNNATLNLKQLNIVNSTGSALVASSTGSNGHGVTASGNGSGEGMSLTGGATGNGLEAIGGATSGHGAYIRAATSGHGMLIEAADSGSEKAGLKAVGSATSGGTGIYALGGGTEGDGFIAEGVGIGSGAGFLSTGSGGALAVLASGTGYGARITGGTDKSALLCEGGGTGHGVQFKGGATGHGLFAQGGATSGNGVEAFVPVGGLGHGMALSARGSSKHGLIATGGTSGTSDGIKAVAGTGGVDIRGELSALTVDTFAEVGQEAPAATQTIRKMIAYLYKLARNKKEQTSTAFKLYNDAGDTVDQKSTVSEDGTTFTSGEIGAGP